VLRILDSPGFIRSGRISELLRFLVERSLQEHGDRPKETVLGVEVFGRTPGYDTQADPVVRVTARRLRSKLKQFYQATGRDDPVRMELPPGGYVLKFSFRDQSEEQRPAALALARTLIGPGKALFDHFNGPRLVVEGLRQSTGSGTPSHPVFSPDGRAIAFDWRGPEDAAEGL
jgi:hypothetical protein